MLCFIRMLSENNSNCVVFQLGGILQKATGLSTKWKSNHEGIECGGTKENNSTYHSIYFYEYLCSQLHFSQNQFFHKFCHDNKTKHEKCDLCCDYEVASSHDNLAGNSTSKNRFLIVQLCKCVRQP